MKGPCIRNIIMGVENNGELLDSKTLSPRLSD